MKTSEKANKVKRTLIRKISEPFPIEGEDGIERQHVLKEMDGQQKHEWDRFVNLQRHNRAEDEEPGDQQAYEATLIQKCLYMVDVDGKQSQYDLATLANWPPTIQDDLFLDCLKINSYLKEERDKEKKGLKKEAG